MSSNPEVEGIVALRPDPIALQALPEVAPVFEPQAGALPPVGSPAEPVAPRAKGSRPLWLPSVAVGAVAMMASSGLAYLLYDTANHRGNSGGPVVDSSGRVVAVVPAKLVGTGVEALSLAIPVHVACLKLVACTLAP